MTDSKLFRNWKNKDWTTCNHQYLSVDSRYMPGWHCCDCGVGILSLSVPIPIPVMQEAVDILTKGN